VSLPVTARLMRPALFFRITNQRRKESVMKLNPPLNTIIHGNCIEELAKLPPRCTNLIVTDPPYITQYQDRHGRSVLNDDNADWLEPAFTEMYRVLARDSFCISFYGWPKADLFLNAWRKAGFRIAGHLVFRKRYGSKKAFLEYRHEMAYLLVKGRPPFPAARLPDVLDWTYTGNKLHPTQKPTGILKPLIEAFSQPGDTVLDSFAGSGSTLAAAAMLGRRYIGIELDAAHHQTATERLANIAGRQAV
jgi:site-specific DNA-methyltransferase (adenine-specific)